MCDAPLVCVVADAILATQTFDEPLSRQYLLTLISVQSIPQISPFSYYICDQLQDENVDFDSNT